MSEDLKTSLEEAVKFFSQAASRKSENGSEAQSNTTSLVGAAEFFAAAKARPQEKTEKEKSEELERRKETYRRWIKSDKENLAKDIQGVMLNKYSCVLKEITPTLSQDPVFRKRLVEFSNKYMEQVTKDKIEWFHNLLRDCEEIEKVIETLRAYYDDMENVITAEYEKYFDSLYEHKDEELVLEAKRIETATKAERDLLILQYKTLFLEFIVYIEQKREILRNRPKF